MRFLNLELQKKKKNGSTFNLNPYNIFWGDSATNFKYA